jgi:hypothetical protein
MSAFPHVSIPACQHSRMSAFPHVTKRLETAQKS